MLTSAHEPVYGTGFPHSSLAHQEQSPEEYWAGITTRVKHRLVKKT